MAAAARPHALRSILAQRIRIIRAFALPRRNFTQPAKITGMPPRNNNNRIRREGRAHGDRAAARAQRLAVLAGPPRRSSRLAVSGASLLQELASVAIAPVRDCSQHKELIDVLQREVDSQPRSKWVAAKGSVMLDSEVHMKQLLCVRPKGSPALCAAAEEVARAVLSSGPACPRCGNSLSSHSISVIYVNLYEEGAGLCAHLDAPGDGVGVAVLLPGQGAFAGGHLRVASTQGEKGMAVRGDAATCSRVVARRSRDMRLVPLYPYAVAVFDGVNRWHEISRVTLGRRYCCMIDLVEC